MEEKDFQERLEKARKKEEVLRRKERAHARKRQVHRKVWSPELFSPQQKTSHEVQEEENEDSYLPDSEEDNLSPEVRELMRKLEMSRRKDTSIVDDEPTCTKVRQQIQFHGFS